MDSNESLVQQELSAMTTEELESMTDIHISLKEDAPQDLVRDFYLRQSVARKLLNERLGIADDELPVGSSIWSRKRAP